MIQAAHITPSFPNPSASFTKYNPNGNTKNRRLNPKVFQYYEAKIGRQYNHFDNECRTPENPLGFHYIPTLAAHYILKKQDKSLSNRAPNPTGHATGHESLTNDNNLQVTHPTQKQQEVNHPNSNYRYSDEDKQVGE